MLEAAGLLVAEPGAVAAFIREHATVLDRAQVIHQRDCIHNNIEFPYSLLYSSNHRQSQIYKKYSILRT